MYDELVKRLRGYANLVGEYNENPGLFNEAADAIEELSKLADAIPHVCECCVGCELEKKNGGCDNAFVLSPKRAMQYLIKPRWIPVSEQLPPLDKNVLVFAYNNYLRIWCLHRPNPEVCDTYWWRENGTYKKVPVVTHWMPLPEPPKEEK